MMRLFILLLCFIFNVGFAQAKTEDPTSDVYPISAYGTYNGTILPIKVASDGTVVTSGGGGGGTPGGSTTQVQYNNAGSFGGITGATTNGTTLTLVAPVLGAATATSINKIAITGPATSGALIYGTDAASITFQGTGTVVNRDSTDTLTNKTYDTAGTGNTFKINGTTISSISGNTSKVATANGTLTSGNCAKFDASGNIVDNGSTCGAGGGSGTVTSSILGRPAYYPSSSNTVTGFIYQFYSTTNNSSSGVDNPVSIPFTVNNSGTAGYTALKINVTETTTGSGLKFLQDWQVGGTSKANMDNTGGLTASSVTTNGTSAGILKLKEPSGTGSDYLALQAPSSIPTSVTWTLPSSDSSGCFQSNGSGTISIASCGSGSGTVNSGTQYQLGIYATTGTAISGISDLTYDTSVHNFRIKASEADMDIYDTSASGSGAGSYLSLIVDDGAAIVNGDTIGNITFTGSEDSSHTIGSSAAKISVDAAGTFSSSSHPASMSFYTTPSGSTTKVSRMTIDSAGGVTIANATGGSAATLCVSTAGKLGKVTGGTLTAPTCTTF